MIHPSIPVFLLVLRFQSSRFVQSVVSVSRRSLLHVGVLDVPQRDERLLDGLRRRPLQHVVRPARLVVRA